MKINVLHIALVGWLAWAAPSCKPQPSASTDDPADSTTGSGPTSPVGQGGGGFIPPANWTWMGGANTINASGHYGTRGVTDPAGAPGARSGAVSWTDALGNLWVFGGTGSDSTGTQGLLNDLWSCDRSGPSWTWISGSSSAQPSGTYGTRGVADPANAPGGREGAVSWVDLAGNLWLFGGHGVDGSGTIGKLNDLWKFDINTSNWTWVLGPQMADEPGFYGTKNVPSSTNIPGARERAVAWVDPSGLFWMFGGEGLDAAGSDRQWNDLWRFDPETTRWTWVWGSDTPDAQGSYVSMAASWMNIPGARKGAVSWVDGSGDLWMFGGLGFDSAGAFGRLNDLWKFERGSKNWAWVSGSKSVNQVGTHGSPGSLLPPYVPGAREGAVAWTDANGAFWLYGGNGYDPAWELGTLGDLWKYEWGMWSLALGPDTVNQLGLYGTLGITDSSSSPGCRERAVAWADQDGNFWLFGGNGFAASGAEGGLSDLWFLMP
jgi:N-acetylneuraminic acid mutarotase